MTNRNRQAEYAKYISATGGEIVVCGRQRQMLELLIAAREGGKGARKGGTQQRLWNQADAVRNLALHGCMLGVRVMHFPDDNSATGRGSVTDYYLLEPWVRASEVFDRRTDAEESSVAPSQWPQLEDAFAPFLKSGSIALISDIKLLEPAKQLSSAAAIQAARAAELLALSASEGK